MKYLWRLAFMAVIFLPVAYANAEATTIKRKTTKLRAFENFERHVAALNNYSVVYTEADRTQRVIKSASGRQNKKSGVITLELRPAKKVYVARK